MNRSNVIGPSRAISARIRSTSTGSPSVGNGGGSASGRRPASIGSIAVRLPPAIRRTPGPTSEWPPSRTGIEAARPPTPSRPPARGRPRRPRRAGPTRTAHRGRATSPRPARSRSASSTRLSTSAASPSSASRAPSASGPSRSRTMPRIDRGGGPRSWAERAASRSGAWASGLEARSPRSSTRARTRQRAFRFEPADVARRSGRPRRAPRAGPRGRAGSHGTGRGSGQRRLRARPDHGVGQGSDRPAPAAAVRHEDHVERRIEVHRQPPARTQVRDQSDPADLREPAGQGVVGREVRRHVREPGRGRGGQRHDVRREAVVGQRPAVVGAGRGRTNARGRRPSPAGWPPIPAGPARGPGRSSSRVHGGAPRTGDRRDRRPRSGPLPPRRARTRPDVPRRGGSARRPAPARVGRLPARASGWRMMTSTAPTGRV